MYDIGISSELDSIIYQALAMSHKHFYIVANNVLLWVDITGQQMIRMSNLLRYILLGV